MHADITVAYLAGLELNGFAERSMGSFGHLGLIKYVDKLDTHNKYNNDCTKNVF